MRNRWLWALLFSVFAAVFSGTTAAEQSASREGLSVRGHWTIDIRRPDGTLAGHHEFDNAMLNAGRQTLSLLLTRQAVPGYWAVRLFNTANQPCTDGGVLPALCVIAEPETRQGSGAYVNRSLTVATTATEALPGYMFVVLSGTTTAMRDGSIATVSTALSRCTEDIADCWPPEFTHHNLDSPIAVTTGQIIQVRVEISFP